MNDQLTNKEDKKIKIEIFGTGCNNCDKLEKNARKAAQELGIEFEIEKVQDIHDMVERGVLITPSLTINGNVEISGKVESSKKIKKLLEKKVSP